MDYFYQIAQTYFRGTISATDEKQLSEWLKDDAHKQLFDTWKAEWRAQAKAQASNRTKAAWERLVESRKSKVERPFTERTKTETPTIRPLRRFYYAAAIGLLLIGVGSLLWLMRPGSTSATQAPFMAQTGVNEQQNFVLPDGTEVMMNSHTTLACATDFGTHDRQITFDGEAEFHVTPDVDKPFVINVGDYNVTVLGTVFNLTAYTTDSIYTLRMTSGKVKVKYLQDSLLAETGDLVQFNTVTHLFRKKLEANNIRLSDLVQRLERLYDVRIAVTEPSLSQETLFISINTDDRFEDVCAALETLLPIRITKENELYLISAQ